MTFGYYFKHCIYSVLCMHGHKVLVHEKLISYILSRHWRQNYRETNLACGLCRDHNGVLQKRVLLLILHRPRNNVTKPLTNDKYVMVKKPQSTMSTVWHSVVWHRSIRGTMSISSAVKYSWFKVSQTKLKREI